jgi:CBS-domain-containing membrane protein
MSDEGAGYYAAAQRTDHSREEIEEMIEQARENADMDHEDVKELVENNT